MFLNNPILMSDSYKASHYCQYPPNTSYVYSYIESRGGAWDKTVFFGLQMFLKTYLTKPITAAMVDEAAEFFAAHGEPFYREGWDYIVNDLGGKLPIQINAVPEGCVVPTHNVLATVVNTDPKCFWLTSFMETAILRAIWYGTTVATKSYMGKQVILKHLAATSDDPAGQISFKLHDFGGRGVSSSESAMIAGAAHLVNFMGSDTVEGVWAANKFYRAGMAGFSIPAAEHSTITSWGQDHEIDAYRNMLTQFAKPGALVAVVSDSYDLWNAVDNLWGGSLKDEVVNSGAILVVRPDSGDPLTVPVEVVKRLDAKFGSTVNAKGYRVLNHVRVIQGDGLKDETVIDAILTNLTAAGYSADNMAFGMGGGLLQQVNRDTLRFAMKCSAISTNGTDWIDVYKDPVTDTNKRSKRGRLALIREGQWMTVPKEGNHWRDQLRTVYRDGDLLIDQTFAEIRERANT